MPTYLYLYLYNIYLCILVPRVAVDRILNFRVVRQCPRDYQEEGALARHADELVGPLCNPLHLEERETGFNLWAVPAFLC